MNINKDSKKIAVIVKYFHPVSAGIETNIRETYSVLVKKGWDVSLHTSTDTLTQKDCLKSQDKLKGIKIERYTFSSFGFFPKLDWKKTDVVCLHNFDIFPHFWILAYCVWLKLTGQKKFALILIPHGGYNPEWSIFTKIKSRIKKLYHFTLGTVLINLVVDGIRAVSNWEAEQIISKGVKKEIVEVIPNGVEDQAYLDVEKLASSQMKEKVVSFGKYIIQIGRIYPIKNYETTIKALTQLPKNINYVIAGPLDYVMGKAIYKQELDRLIKQLGLQKRVHFVGVVTGVDKYYLIKKAQLMVHMALWESFCNVVHEGLSQGLSCIVANNTALPYLIKDEINGFCVETRNDKKVAEKIRFILENKQKTVIKEMESRNRVYGLENSWNKIAQDIDTYYFEVLTRVVARQIDFQLLNQLLRRLINLK